MIEALNICIFFYITKILQEILKFEFILIIY
jgi:hypothetical protein